MEGSERLTVKDITAQLPPDISVPLLGVAATNLASPPGVHLSSSGSLAPICLQLPWSFLATHHLSQGGQSPQGRNWGESCLQRELTEGRRDSGTGQNFVNGAVNTVSEHDRHYHLHQED